jgi:predicted DNA-binding transcriptional regulator AlpA
MKKKKRTKKSNQDKFKEIEIDAEDVSNDISQAWTVEDIAGHLGISVRQVWRMDAAGQIPAAIGTRIGNRKRWRSRDIKDWLDWECPDREKFTKLKARKAHDKDV